MAENPLFYQTIEPLNRERHRDLRLKQEGRQYAFAARAHVIPAVVDEFAAAARFLPIVFLAASPSPTSVFLVGLLPGQNALVDNDGEWTEGYVPAFARRYPFMLGETGPGLAPVVCIDEKYDGFEEKKGGERLFAEDGGATPFLQERIKLMNDYYAAAQRTEAFLRALSDLQLLQPVTIESRLAQGSNTVLHGFLTIDETRFNGLPDDEFLKLHKQGFLPAIYGHFLSLGSIDRLRRPKAGSPLSPKPAGV